jgi:hypothetical protein
MSGQPAWGSSRAAFLATAPDQPYNVSEVDGEIVVQRNSAEWNGTPARILHIFANDKLVRSKFIFSTEHSDPTSFVADYAAIAARMLKEYGKPTGERAVWENDSLQEEKIAYLQQDRALPSDVLPSDKNVGLSIALGHLKLYAQWCGPQTEILHTLTGVDHTVTHQIELRSVELKALESGSKACTPPVL